MKLPIKAISLITMAMLLLFCSRNEKVTGVVETGNTKITGRVVDNELQGVPNLEVTLSSKNPLVKIGLLKEGMNNFNNSEIVSEFEIQKDTTDATGRFELWVEENLPNELVLETRTLDSSKIIQISFLLDSLIDFDLGVIPFFLDTGEVIEEKPFTIDTLVEFKTDTNVVINVSNILIDVNYYWNSFDSTIVYLEDGLDTFTVSDESEIILFNVIPGQTYQLIAIGGYNFSDTVRLKDIVGDGRAEIMQLDVNFPMRNEIWMYVDFMSNKVDPAIAYLIGDGDTLISNINSNGTTFNVLSDNNYQAVVVSGYLYSDTMQISNVMGDSLNRIIPLNFEFPIRALIVDGINNHSWEKLTTATVQILNKTGYIEAVVSTTPTDGASPAEWAFWQPNFSKYHVVISNYNTGDRGVAANDYSINRWPVDIEIEFENYIRNGGGMVNTGCTFPAFGGWSFYQEIKGWIWTTENSKPGVQIDSNGLVVDIPAGTGRTAFGDGKDTARIVNTLGNHPINSGLPAQWLHPREQYVFGLRGDSKDIQVLAHVARPGDGIQEPVMWIKEIDKGRIFTTTLGDLHVNSPEDNNIRCIGYQTTLIRGIEWAGSGEVKYTDPSTFPSTTDISLGAPFNY